VINYTALDANMRIIPNTKANFKMDFSMGKECVTGMENTVMADSRMET
jgi:hypothetical protein